MKAYKIIQTIFNQQEVRLIVKKEDLLMSSSKNKTSDNEKAVKSEIKTLKLEQSKYLELIEKTKSKNLNSHLDEILEKEVQENNSFVLVEEKNYTMLPELLGMFENEKYEKISGIILNY